MFFSKKELLYSPLKGMIFPITQAPDEAFSQKMVGDGICIDPEDGLVVSPVNGTVTTILPSKHAIGIQTKKGNEILVHFGMDTVSLNGEGFTQRVKTGDKVKVGDLILEVNLQKIRDKVPSLITPVVITNMEGKIIRVLKEGQVNRGEEIIEIK
ncbi:PTS sugar transporter subunit IIA [Garciella nitratireducens]|uniref:PTS sugar transporter subunit IIA n=1 Tax=Garciella nitratireducens TaxID=218205 RepID=UPI000DE91D09|nr:PTS glucose transporter subunit IIA [Garciella nitratireducens]RBP41542.1 PTS system IIA component (Glc family) [Garciella nitratireducens]